MKHFYSLKDVHSIDELVTEAIDLKRDSSSSELGKGKTLVMIFFNGSLRTRLSTQLAAESLGMNVICINANDAWPWELEEGAIMNADKAEHIKEASKVISQYADVIAIRSFPQLVDRAEDYQDKLLSSFIKYAEVPVVNLESSILHPCQALADMITIREHQKKKKNKIVVTWAPHPKALPQAVVNSFLSWASKTENEIVLTHPKGYELNEQFTKNCTINHNQDEALKNADFVYVKNWSSYQSYGKILSEDPSWMLDASKLALTNNAKLMHCLPVRRNVVIADDVLDSENALIYQQANNRTFAAKSVLARLLKNRS